MFEKLKRLLGIRSPTFAPSTLEERVKRALAPILHVSATKISDDVALGRHAEEVCVVLTFSLGRTIHTSTDMTVGELIAQLEREV